jgi:hypothetical protein
MMHIFSEHLITALAVLCWLLLAAVVWRALPLPQLPVLAVRRRWALLAMPWPGRLALGLRVELVVLAR